MSGRPNSPISRLARQFGHHLQAWCSWIPISLPAVFFCRRGGTPESVTAFRQMAERLRERATLPATSFHKDLWFQFPRRQLQCWPHFRRVSSRLVGVVDNSHLLDWNDCHSKKYLVMSKKLLGLSLAAGLAAAASSPALAPARACWTSDVAGAACSNGLCGNATPRTPLD